MDLPRLLTSSKYQAALGSTVLGGVAIGFILANHSLDPTAKQALIDKTLTAVGAVWVTAIGGTSLEDMADKHKPGPTSPLQVNANTSDSTQANVPAAAPPSDPPSAPPASVVVPKTPVKPSGGAAVTVSTNPTYHAPVSPLIPQHTKGK